MRCARRSKTKTLALIALALGLAGCAPAVREYVLTGPQASELEKKIEEADALIRKGCYIGFKRAVSIYEELFAQPALRDKIALPYLRTLLLLAVREKDLGMIDETFLQRAFELSKAYPGLKGFEPYLVLADQMPLRTKGVIEDIDIVQTKRTVDEVLAGIREKIGIQAELRAKAAAEDYYAYLYVSFFSGYASFIDQKSDVADVLKLHPDSILMKYRNAIQYPQEKPEVLDELANSDPDFYEAHYHLGEVALGRGKLLEAEKQFLKAFEGIPESPQITILLAAVYFANEEFDRSLEFYEKTIGLAPEYRDALLGKAICLSYMGKYQDAIDVLDKLVSLGSWLMGETHYWLAWNLRELQDLDRAQTHIEESKGRLPTNSEVFGLAGTIALEKGELDKAEKESKEALVYNSANSEALFNLGRLYAQKEKWADSGAYYEKAAAVFEKNEAAAFAKIEEIKGSLLSDERKARLLAKKDQQLKIIQATKATACYYAALSLANAGQKEKALDLAERAALHPQFKERAGELIAQIKSKK
jgi:tetratricopeptide (TPR) repeat protein